jgi:hypothetical protein
MKEEQFDIRGMRRLANAIIHSALKGIERPICERDFGSALRFFNEPLSSFQWCCDVLELNTGVMRDRVEERLATVERRVPMHDWKCVCDI